MGTDPAPGYTFDGAPALEGTPSSDHYNPDATLPRYEYGGAPTIAGEFPDKDAQTINSLVQQEADPPGPDDRPKAAVEKLDKVAIPNRLLTVTQVLPSRATGVPVLLLPADPARVALNVRVISATATDTALLADDGGKLQVGNGGALVLAIGQAIPLDGFTGPVWAVASDANTGPTYITVAAVTK